MNMFSSSRRIVNCNYFIWPAFTHGLFSIRNKSAPAVKSHKPSALRSLAPGGWHQLQEALTNLWWKKPGDLGRSTEMAPKTGSLIADMAIQWGMWWADLGRLVLGQTQRGSELETSTWSLGWWWYILQIVSWLWRHLRKTCCQQQACEARQFVGLGQAQMQRIRRETLFFAGSIEADWSLLNPLFLNTHT